MAANALRFARGGHYPAVKGSDSTEVIGMAEQKEDQEPTMEEILASIRRIISEDEPDGGGDAADAPGALAADAAEPAALADDVSLEPVAGDDGDTGEFDGGAAEAVLDLTERVEDDEDDDLMVIDSVAEAAPEPEPAAPVPDAPAAAPLADPHAKTDQIVSEPVAAATAGAFGALISNLLVSSRSGEGKTLEDLVGDLLRPMLQDWLDTNLRDIVEARVADEVEKISARARR